MSFRDRPTTRRGFLAGLAATAAGSALALAVEPVGHVDPHPTVESHQEVGWYTLWVRGTIENHADVPIAVEIDVTWFRDSHSERWFADSHDTFQVRPRDRRHWGLPVRGTGEQRLGARLARIVNSHRVTWSAEQIPEVDDDD